MTWPSWRSPTPLADERAVPMSRATRDDAGRRWPLSRIVGVAVLALLLFSVAVVVVGEIALASAHDTSTALDAVFIAVAIGLLLTVLLLALGLRATAIRPLHRLAAQVRRVAGGDFDHEVTVPGPREVTQLAADVNTMRERILQELSATQENNAILQAHATELQRSNSELEQFAYVASHDLQEPLRKVASFTQLLQRRYAGKLDARADQYIDFAVDGAKRMQALINDLLAYSRVGRSDREPALVSSDAALTQARANLAEQIEETGATIETGHLPLVLAELPLLIAVFQNLLSNALKFSGEKAPRVVVTVSRDEPFWLFSFGDNGIGIEPEYSERIFVIFQRLHERTAYAGTGIGLSMTRKIIEYFGGRIWLDTAFTGGTRFCFTLPMPQETMTPELEDPMQDADNQSAAALLLVPDPAAEPEDRQDEETDDRLQ
jgi:signal transduction histidine kinase